MSENHLTKFQAFKAQDEAQIEQQFLNGVKDLDLGVYTRLFSAKCAFEGQDGGVVTALLIKGLREGLFDVAVVVQRGEGYSAEVVVAQNPKEIEAAKCTKYLKVNVSQKVKELLSQDKPRLAVVCTPCEAKAVRKIQQKFQSAEITVIGLFCFESFNSHRLKQTVEAKLGVNLDCAQKTQIRQGKFIAQIEGQEYACRVRDLEEAANKTCRLCDDFTARFADVSVGSVGSKLGYSTVVVRSEVGERLVKGLDCVLEEADKAEVTKLAKFKAERAKKRLAALQHPN